MDRMQIILRCCRLKYSDKRQELETKPKFYFFRQYQTYLRCPSLSCLYLSFKWSLICFHFRPRSLWKMVQEGVIINHHSARRVPHCEEFNSLGIPRIQFVVLQFINCCIVTRCVNLGGKSEIYHSLGPARQTIKREHFSGGKNMTESGLTRKGGRWRFSLDLLVSGGRAGAE